MNYYVVSICPPAIQRLFFRAITHVVQNGPPKKLSASRVFSFTKEETPGKQETAARVA